MLDEIKSKLEIIEENISEFERYRNVNYQMWNTKKMKKIEQSIRNLWNKFMWPNMYAQLKYQKKKKKETIHKKIWTEENGIIEKPEEGKGRRFISQLITVISLIKFKGSKR